MANIQDLIEEALDNEDDGEELADFISEGTGEDLDALEEPIRVDETFPTTVFIYGAPKVGREKYEKLRGVLAARINKFGTTLELYMPINEKTNETEGFIVVTFSTEQEADAAATSLNLLSLDRRHVLKAVKFDELDEILGRSDEFHPVHALRQQAFFRGDFRQWLLDEKCREQLLLRYQAETEIYWHDTMERAPVLYYGGERQKAQKKIWCDSRVEWSPMGSFIATFHKQGIALWGGQEFKENKRFAHELSANAHIEFSPNEEFLLVWNGSHFTSGDDGAVRIFRTLTGECMFKARTPSVAPLGGDFPHFLWSPDGQFFLECMEAAIAIRETSTFEVIRDGEGKRARLKFDGLSTCQWSPKDNYLAVWTLEKANNPARLVLLEIPSRRELASRSRTQCEATMHWQTNGDYLCLLVTKLKKTKKQAGTNLEIFRVRMKNIPVDIVEVAEDCVKGFFWETAGDRFAVLTTTDAGHKPKLLIYLLSADKCEQVVSFDLPNSNFNQVYWAPNGQYFIVCACEFGDLLFCGLTPDNRLELLHKDEHFMLKNVEWDPSSRYVITSVTQDHHTGGGDLGALKYSTEAGYTIWTFQGRALYKQQKEKLYQIKWRPHPKSLLSNKRQADIKKNIKTFSKRYDALDDQAKEAARQAFKRERDQKTNVFMDVLDRLNDYKAEKSEELGWDEAWNDFQEGQGWENHEQTLEEELDVTEELISG